MKTEEKVYDLHNDHKEWKNKLDFYRDELDILEGRLGEIASKNNHKEMMKQVEHFQNQFIIQKNNIKDISREVKQNEKKLINSIKSNPVAVDHRKTAGHSKERELVNGFEKNFNSIRSEFKDFAAKWM